ncbi:hypothetical protein O181_071420 [Austropuccinia psidii MF-1]|uniref:Uncharacterized protein n=1 Tax=Austropuccinia psidii MF-1 TaxID=1389203 RepID=A0A9Q3EYF2_9BASI|nr:hypothetical protein [Austropuccinia psidii MF-1]
MPKTQSTEGGSTEREDSVSSVSLELMTKDLCKQKNSRHQNNALQALKNSSKKWGHNLMMGPSESSKIRIQGLLGLKSLPKTSPSPLGGQVLDEPRLGPIDPLKPQYNWVQRPLTTPTACSVPTVYYGPQTVGHQDIK